ncbi:MAG: helix-turn-helix transcriptional regulator [Ktedonobacteraceae bacterium]|nr:helix-turn-helix transcriptional regulator [Ktedonobacteraceae bacterium]
MSNERLRQAMIAAHVDIDTITEATNVDPKTVQRWLNGRVPHARHRWKVAELLKEHEDFLWPADEDVIPTTTHTSEVIAAYAHRSDVLAHAWWQLFLRAKERIDLLGYAMLFLPEQHPYLVDLLKEKAQASCKVRIAIADPSSTNVQMRDEEELLGGTLSAHIQTTLYYFRELCNYNNIEIHYHATPMYNSIFHCDNEMFVTPHLYSLPGSKAPLLHLRRLGQHGIFENFATHFERIWATTTPVPLHAADPRNYSSRVASE